MTDLLSASWLPCHSYITNLLKDQSVTKKYRKTVQMLIKQNECTSLLVMYVIFYISSITLEKASILSMYTFIFVSTYLLSSKCIQKL